MSKEKKTALILGAVIFLLLAGSLVYLLLSGQSKHKGTIAEIWQNGKVIEEINLSEVTETYQFTVVSDEGEDNVIEVRPGEIGVVSATCPDGICVSMGFISDSTLPITCLPHLLVIRILGDDEDAPDISTY